MTGSGAGGAEVTVCRTGYTGEHGYELIPAWGDAETVFRALLPEITSRDGQPAGLGARDTLRTEMGYPLHGHELTVDITPVQARAGWAVGWKKPEFVGREAIIAAKAVAFGEALKPEFKDYAAQIVTNAKALAEELVKGGLDIVSGGTDCHMVLCDLRPLGVTGKAAELILSDDPKASKKIERFATGSARIAVCVRMISEGVDVPRLCVGVYATSSSTPSTAAATPSTAAADPRRR